MTSAHALISRDGRHETRQEDRHRPRLHIDERHDTVPEARIRQPRGRAHKELE